MTELLPCPFERGQVWKDAEDNLILITSVCHFNHGRWVADFVKSTHWKEFYNQDDAHEVSGLVCVSRASPPPDHFVDVNKMVDVEKLKLTILLAAPRCQDTRTTTAWTIDHLAASGYLRAPLEKIEGLEDVLRVKAYERTDTEDGIIEQAAAPKHGGEDD